ncbi:hypothetical protein AB1L30_07860 [Bremerella sp. JC817]
MFQLIPVVHAIAFATGAILILLSAMSVSHSSAKPARHQSLTGQLFSKEL